MIGKKINLPLSLVLLGTLIVVGAASPAHCQPPATVYVYPIAPAPAPAPMAAPAPVAGGHFERTATGSVYYIDATGAKHLIERSVTPPGGGIYYYVEGDKRPYAMDAYQRLYYSEPSGMVYYIEGTTPAGGVVYRGVAPGAAPPMAVPMMPAMPAESCATQWQKCVYGCSGISPRKAYDRPDCMRNCDVIRASCRDQ